MPKLRKKISKSTQISILMMEIMKMLQITKNIDGYLYLKKSILNFNVAAENRFLE